MIELRPNLPPLPDRMRHLPVHRGYPVPFFVAWVNGEPDFRIMDGEKMPDAIRFGRCWLCGQSMGRYQTFVTGPMCGVSRTSAEPPSHLDCAEFAAKACPFLSMPKMDRREGGLPKVGMAGISFPRNPGVTLLWTTRDWGVFGDGSGRPLFRMGDPTRTQWFAEGRLATRAEVVASIESGLPSLRELARGPADLAELEAARTRLNALVPA